MPEHEFVEIGLKLGFTDSMIGTDQPLLEIPYGAIGEWNSRLRALSECRSQRLSAGDMFESRFRQPRKALEAIGVDGRTGRDILVEEGDDGAALEIWDRFHADATRTSATPLHCDQNQRCPSPFELSATAEASLLATNPRFINLYLAVQRFPGEIHHRSAEFVKQHPGGLVTGQSELPLE
jgi:hypothetical protein